MTACEKCWTDAYTRARSSPADRVEAYHQLLIERKENPCTPEEQAGQFWDPERQRDRREA